MTSPWTVMSRHRSCKAKPDNRLCLLCFLLLLVSPVSTWGWTGKTIRVTAGDILTVLKGETLVTIRLYGIDCPKGGQPFGREVRQFTSQAVFGKTVEVYPFADDRFGHTIAMVEVNGLVLNEELIRAGMARVHPHLRMDRIRGKWKRLEAEARAAKRGLWAEPNPIPAQSSMECPVSWLSSVVWKLEHLGPKRIEAELYLIVLSGSKGLSDTKGSDHSMLYNLNTDPP